MNATKMVRKNDLNFNDLQGDGGGGGGAALSKCAGNFAAFKQFLATYPTLDFTRSPLGRNGTWCWLPNATKHFDRAGGGKGA